MKCSYFTGTGEKLSPYKQFCNLITCAAEVLTPLCFFGTNINITSLVSLLKDMSEVILNPAKKRGLRTSAVQEILLQNCLLLL
jgi:hypothetical protein